MRLQPFAVKYIGKDCPNHGAQMVRLYVGGLPADVTAEQLAERFAPFGRVEGADLAAPQTDGCAALKDASCRGFGYVELDPKDEAALRRCLSTVRPWEPCCAVSSPNCKQVMQTLLLQELYYTALA